MAQPVRARTQSADWVDLVHPDIPDGVHRCSESAVAHWEARGWKRKDKPSGTPRSGSAAAKTGSES